MAKRIIDMVLARSAAMRDTPRLADRNALLGTAALHGGIRSAAWRTYMMQFVEQDPRGTPVNPKQLERLLGTDGTLGDPDLDMKRAYLVGNSPCGSTTPDRLPFTVDSIDEDLGSGCIVPLEATGDDGDPTPPIKRPKKGKGPKWP